MIEFVIRDYATKAFIMPETITPPDPLDLPENGMGLYIIFDTFDTVDYEHMTDGNQWQLKKRIEG